jgi:hypothetical protein
MKEIRYSYQDYLEECKQYKVNPLSRIELSLRNGVDRELEEARQQQQQPSAPAPKAEERPASIHADHWWLIANDVNAERCIATFEFDDDTLILIRNRKQDGPLTFDYRINNNSGVLQLEADDIINLEWLTPAPAAPPAESVGDAASARYDLRKLSVSREYWMMNFDRVSTENVELQQQLAASRAECQRLRTALESLKGNKE